MNYKQFKKSSKLQMTLWCNGKNSWKLRKFYLTKIQKILNTMLVD